MNIKNLTKVFIAAGLFGLFGCGGGGGGGSAAPATTPTTTDTTTTTTTPTTTTVTTPVTTTVTTTPTTDNTPVYPPATAKTTTTISGKAEFPALTSLVAKRVDAVVPDATVTVQAFTLAGVPVGPAVNPTYEDTVAGAADYTKRGYSYVLPDIPFGNDYIIKAKYVLNGKTQELKKLLEKSDVTENPLDSGNINSVSTTAVVIASQKLTTSMNSAAITLGDPLPASLANSVTDLSAKISTDISPKALETSIQTSKDRVANAILSGNIASAFTGLSQDDKTALVNFVNLLNIVVAAVANNETPANILAGSSTVALSATTSPLKLLSVDGSGNLAQAPATTSLTSSVVMPTVTNATTSYIPPRVKLVISTDSTAIYGLVFEITMPVDAYVGFDAAGKLNMAQLTLPAGYADAQYSAATRKVRVAVASTTAKLATDFITLNFAKTIGKTLTTSDFTISVLEASDVSGNKIATTFNLSTTVTSSGS